MVPGQGVPYLPENIPPPKEEVPCQARIAVGSFPSFWEGLL